MATAVLKNPKDARKTVERKVKTSLVDLARNPELKGTYQVPLVVQGGKGARKADDDAMEKWVHAWQSTGNAPLVKKRMHPTGQLAPHRLEFNTVDQLVEFTSPAVQELHHNACTRVTELLQVLGDTKKVDNAIRTHQEKLFLLTDENFNNLVKVLSWMMTNKVAAYRMREVPAASHSKWVEHHKGLLAPLYQAASGKKFEFLRNDPPMHVKVLDGSLVPGFMTEFSATTEQLSKLPLEGVNVLVVENLESLNALEPRANTVAVHGAGFGSGARVACVSWVREAARLLFWGDLDSQGMLQLHQMRQVLPDTEPVLMDAPTLMAFRDLCHVDKKPSDVPAHLLLKSARRAANLLASEGDVRLEQERIPRAYAESVLTEKLA